MKFSELDIIEPIRKALNEKGYTEPTPIQEKAIPLILEKKDILGCAQTGTGKTAAFAIPIIQQLYNFQDSNQSKPQILSLIITPTRELAIQIDDNIKGYSKHTTLRHAVIFGGVKQGKQVEKLKKGVHILTATPGRLLDLIGQGFIDLRHLQIFVLDEADRMLDMGFINDIKKILKIIPEKRQSLFFSATMPDNIIKLSNNILRNPIKIEVTPASTTAETIKQFVYYTNRTDKTELLLHILKERNIDQVLIFTRTKHGADRVAKNLSKRGVAATAIHGNKAQNQRQNALQDFKDGKMKALVATDIAARGIDIDKLKYVINFEIPNMPETYVHRIGRSGRAGEEGTAISLCEPEENADLKEIQKLIGNEILTAENTAYPQTEKPMTEAEKKEWQKEKQKRKQEFFAQRREGKEGRPKQKKEKKEKKSPKNNGSEKGQKRRSESEPSKRESTPSNENRRQERPQKSREGQRSTSGNEGDKRNNKRNNSNRSKGPRNTNASEALKSKYKWPLE